MRKRITKLQTATGLSWEGTALFDIPTSINIGEIILRLGERLTLDNMHIKLMLNGVSIYELPASEINELHATAGRWQDSTGKTLVIPFDDNTAKTELGRFLGAFTVNPDDIVTLECKIGEKPSSAGISPQLEGDIIYSPSSTLRNTIPRLYEFNTSGGAVGEREYNWNFKDRAIKSLDFKNGVDYLQVERAGVTIFEQTLEANNKRLKRHGWTPQGTGYGETPVFHFRPAIEGYYSADLLEPSNLKFTMKCTNSGSIKVVCNTIEVVEVLQN